MMRDNICVKRQQDVLLFTLLRLRFQTSHYTVCPLEAFSNLTTSQSFALDTTKTSHIVHYFFNSLINTDFIIQWEGFQNPSQDVLLL